MTPILPELVNAVIEERRRQAQMRYVSRSRARPPRRLDRLSLRWLAQISELTRAPMTEIDPR